MSNGTSNACGTCGSVVYPHVCAVPAAPVAGSYAVTTNITYAPQPPSSDVLVRQLREPCPTYGTLTKSGAPSCEVTRRAAAEKIEFYREREEHFASVLKVCDGGRWRNDWDASIRAVVDERDAAASRIETLEKERDGIDEDRNFYVNAYHDMTAAHNRQAERADRAEADLTRARDALTSMVGLAKENTALRDLLQNLGLSYHFTAHGTSPSFDRCAAVMCVEVRRLLSGPTSTETSPAREEETKRDPWSGTAQPHSCEHPVVVHRANGAECWDCGATFVGNVDPQASLPAPENAPQEET